MNRERQDWTNVRLMKNGEKMMNLFQRMPKGHLNISGGMALQLEVGDVVNMVLAAGNALFDDHNNHSMFTGFLLFSL